MRPRKTPNTDTFHGVSLHVQSECGEMWTRKTSNTNTLHRVSLHIQFECGEMRTRKTLNTDTFHGFRFSYTTLFTVGAYK